MTVVVRSGIAAGERRVIDYPERREVTRQFPAPVFARDIDWLELEVRGLLGARFQRVDPIHAAARAKLAGEYMTGARVAQFSGTIRYLLDGFDEQNRICAEESREKYRAAHPDRFIPTDEESDHA